MVRNRLNQQELSKRSRKHWKNHFGSTSTKVERCREGQHGSCPKGPYMHEVVAILSRKGKKRLSVMDWIMFPSNPCVEALTLYVACLETEPFKKKVRSPKDGALIQEDWCSWGRRRDTRLLSCKGRPREDSPLQARKRSLTRNPACWCFDLGLQPLEL